jgi:hypothetical protein
MDLGPAFTLISDPDSDAGFLNMENTSSKHRKADF